MKLRFSSHSPYVRKVRVVAHELGISDRMMLVPTALRINDPDFWHDNPLGKIPVLTTDDGLSYADSVVICEYLDASFGAHRLLPADGARRWRALTTVALADGVADAGMLARQEELRAPALRSAELVDFQKAKVARGLDRLQSDVAMPLLGTATEFDMPCIATACTVGWLVLRFGEEFVFTGRDALSRWYQAASTRPSMQATAPSENS